MIRLKPRGIRRDVDEVIDDLRERIAKTEPAIRADFGQILEDNIYDLAGGVPQPVDVRIYGEDQSLLQQKARQAADILAQGARRRRRVRRHHDLGPQALRGPRAWRRSRASA